MQDGILEVNVLITAPLVCTDPEKEWVDARESALIPAALFLLYEKTQYISFGGAPRFLRDPDNVLFRYFGMIVRCLMEALVDSSKEARTLIEDQNLSYDAGKKFRGEHWDTEADGRARGHFRDLLIALQASLDVLSDLIALFFAGLISGLRLGRARSAKVEGWPKRPIPPIGLIITPYDVHLRELFRSLDPVVNASGPEREWLPLTRMLRNKAGPARQSLL